MGELQLLLVVAVLLHFGLKVMELLLNERGKEVTDRKGEHTSGLTSITCTDAQGQPICITSSDARINVGEKSQAECFAGIN